MSEKLHTTELVVYNTGHTVERMVVPGGWLYMVFTKYGVATQFVPEMLKEDV